MITDALLALVGLFVDALATVLPDIELPGMTQASDFLTSFAGYARAMLNGILPIDDYLDAVAPIIDVWFPALIGVTLALWFWRFVPEIGG